MMLPLVPILATVLPITAITFVIAVFIATLYLRIRRKFPISVNCWFCNSWTKVPYDDRNSFDCPHCSQYNGFAKDGGYNKIIPEQHDELMNKSTRMKTKKTVSNGLCVLCNNNQQLKIFQLANFVPLVEENYDVEIEHFQKQLEKAYKLCRKCDRVLKKTIDTQNAWIFGNRIKNLCSNSIPKLTNLLKKETGLSFLSKLDGFLSVLFVLFVVFVTLFSNKLFTKTLSAYVPTAYHSIYKSVISAANTSRTIEMSVGPYFVKSVKIEPHFATCAAGLTFQVCRIAWRRYATATKVNQLLCWIILILTAWVRSSRHYALFMLLIQAFCGIYLLCTAFSRDEVTLQKHSGKSMRKFVKHLEYTCSDVSDATDFENVSSSSKNCGTSSNSSDYLNKSVYSTLDVPPQNHSGNSSFMSAKSAAPNWDSDLNRSLNNLSLGFKSPRGASSLASFAVRRPKRVLSPPKFQTVNSWVAGGFWREGDGVVAPFAQRSDLSRSSSESSGFGSQHNDFQAGPAKGYVPEFDKTSMNSELSRLSPGLYSEARRGTPDLRNTFYPNLQHNNMLLIPRDRFAGTPGLIRYNEPYQRKGTFENWSDRINAQATQSFRDLSLRTTN
ncbi:hypothetical protein MTP99_016224 [Tenebrio molitor]|uniref:uncharacterized protein n=1 Tax=Tenebrio molitor TaxID=7067 RepID=UPI0026FAA19B|nr:hypothetical protein MTP99_016224 [Tenebrio molitor]